MNTPQKVVLVDGSSYLFRAFYALPQLTNQKGELTGAIFGVINMLRKLPHNLRTNNIAIVFDSKGKNFRHQLYSAYKGNRRKMPQELEVQIQPLHAIIERLGFPLIIKENIEADDVIGTLAKRFGAGGNKVVICTGDKDMAQLVSNNITLLDTMKSEVIDYNGVISKFGVKPTQIVDYLALTGDASDNIPGIPKVGPKTAAKWLLQYENIQGIINNINNISGSASRSLRENLELLALSYKLVTIQCDLDIPVAIDNLCLKTPDEDYLKHAFIKYGFKEWLNSLEQNQFILRFYKEEISANYYSDYKGVLDYKIILTKDCFNCFYDKLSKVKIFAFNTIVDLKNTVSPHIVGISFSLRPQSAVYIPLNHDYENAPKQLESQWVIYRIKSILENKKVLKITQNGKFNLKVLYTANIEVKGLKWDVMLESYLLKSSELIHHDVASLAKYYLQIKKTPFEELIGRGKQQLALNKIDVFKMGAYMMQDIDITYHLHNYIWDKMKKVNNLCNLYIQEELPVSFVIARMENTGVKIDGDLLKVQSCVLKEEIKILKQECMRLAGEDFNLSSPKQLRKILFDKMGMLVSKKTRSGEPSTAEDALQKLAKNEHLPQLIIKHRHLMKLKTTYTDKLPMMISNKTQRVHTSYQQAVVITGRLSSTEPNLQNIPVRSDFGRQIRKAFIAERGFKILSVDYSQIELRIMAHLSGDISLINAFQKGLDIHKATASEIFKIKRSNAITQEHRRRAKAVNFGLIYGMGAFGLSEQLNISHKEAQNYINIYFMRYPKVESYMQHTKIHALQYGFVETIFGRRLYLPKINSKKVIEKRSAERVAINAPVQGSAADIIKQAMILVDRWIVKEKVNAKMIMQVHDELIFEVKNDEVDNIKNKIKQLMESVVLLKVPLIVDTGVGNNWDEAH